MNLARDQFLAGTRLSQNQDQGVSRSHKFHQFQDLLKRRGTAENLAVAHRFTHFFREVAALQLEFASQFGQFFYARALAKLTAAWSANIRNSLSLQSQPLPTKDAQQACNFALENERVRSEQNHFP
jgi:hypothetical protein